MVYSEVRFHDDNTAFIKKDLQVVGQPNYTTAVSLRDKTVLVVSMQQMLNDVPMVLLIKECFSNEKALSTFYKVVGKLCKKDASSKYFESCIVAEHMNNGNPLKDTESIKRYIDTANDLRRIYKSDL